jgi:hypothetical protein
MVPLISTDGGLDYSDPNVQKQLAYLYKQHRGKCAVLDALGIQ